MRVRNVILPSLVFAVLTALVLVQVTTAQAPARGAAAQAPARGAAAAAACVRGVCGTLAQIMRGITFPNSNIAFDVQDNNPGTKKPDPSGPYIGQYQGWEGVENAGIALAESANLILLPGRKCSNGQDVPLAQADFVQFTQALRTTGMAIYNAARAKNQNAIIDLSDRLTETCANCHDKYRPDSRLSGPKVGPEKRCMPGV